MSALGYTVYTQTVAYAEPFLITDLREDGSPPFIYSDKESYDIHRLTIYRPGEGDMLLQNRPVIFFVHGGGWTGGYRDWYQSISGSFTAEMGWITVVIDYRLTSDRVFVADRFCPDRTTCALPANVVRRSKAAEYPDNINDVATAFAWVAQEISDYGGNSDQVIVFGHSAGAHLASLLVFDDAFAPWRPTIRGLAVMSGAFALDEPAFRLIYHDVLDQTFGAPLDLEELQGASPIAHIRNRRLYPGLYFLYCEDELPQFAAQTAAMTNALSQQGIPYRLDWLKGYSHTSEMMAIASVDERPTAMIIDFVETMINLHTYLPLLRM